jgi:hypothetical protein
LRLSLSSFFFFSFSSVAKIFFSFLPFFCLLYRRRQPKPFYGRGTVSYRVRSR